MEPRACRNSFFSKMGRLCWLLICLVSAFVFAFGADATHVVIRENVSPVKQEELAAKLRTITGWTTLHFDSQGTLKLGTDDPIHGSRIARNLLNQAVSGHDFIVIEDASSRPDVAFCRVVQARWPTDTKTQLKAFVVLIDFSDFRQILGDQEARASFDVGWGLLHELDHVVTDSKDSDDQGLPGECENHINAMRQEMGLPVRVDYFFTESALRTNPNFGSKLVRLAFEHFDSNKARKRRYWLVWDHNAVGGLVINNQTAVARSAQRHSK